MGCEAAFGRPPLFGWVQTMRVWACVDGFNLYNGLLKGTRWKWLDLLAFTQALLPGDVVERVKYFTALVDARENDPGQPYRQMTYWRALATVERVQIIRGKFLTKEVLMPEAASVARLRSLAAEGRDVTGERPTMVKVVRSEEKGTDVNLAAHLVHDAHLGRFEAAVVVSNDSDLVEAIRIVRDEIGKVVGVLNPRAQSPSVALRNAASFFRTVRKGVLARCQLADTVVDERGLFHKPQGW